MRALLACIPSSCEKGFRPGQQYHKLPCTEKGEKEEPDPGTRLVLGSALKLLMAETWAWPSLSCLLLPSLKYGFALALGANVPLLSSRRFWKVELSYMRTHS